MDWTDAPPPEFTGGAITIGNFDGVHRGHQALVAAAARWARQVGGPAVAVTFDPAPYQVLFPDTPPRPPLTTLEDKSALLLAAGADHVVVLHATADLLALSPEAFFQEILSQRLQAKAVIEGYDFRFGHRRAGDMNTLRRLCEAGRIGFEEVSPVAVDGEAVSSSRVRSALTAGEVSTAAKLLGRPYSVHGTVVSGARRGQTIGFPTANLGDVPTVLPGNGVYAVRAVVEGARWPAAANVGPNPTFGESARKVEVHLLDFSGNLYGKSMTVQFIAKLRDTRPFAGIAELTGQLHKDVDEARKILSAG